MIAAADAAPPRTEWIARVQERVRAWWAGASAHYHTDASPIRPERLCKALSETCPRMQFWYPIPGTPAFWTGTMLDLRHPSQSFIRCSGRSAGDCPRQWAQNARRRSDRCFAFTGDGGIWYHLAELETALRCGINTVTVVNNNHSLNQEQAGVEAIYGARTAGSDELWHFEDTDFASIAESMGCLGITVREAGEIPAALERAFAADKPVVIDVKTDVARHRAACVAAVVEEFESFADRSSALNPCQGMRLMGRPAKSPLHALTICA